MSGNFNIRVYGLLISDSNELLVSDECRNGYAFTKFPGGGLEWGEGTKDALIREFKEELSIDIEVGELFYLTDFFQESAFRSTDQLISIYYKVFYTGRLEFEHYTFPLTENGERFRWVAMSELSKVNPTFPIDKIVLEKLIESVNPHE